MLFYPPAGLKVATVQMPPFPFLSYSPDNEIQIFLEHFYASQHHLVGFFYSWWYYVPNFFQTFALFRFSNRVIVDPELRGYSHPVHLYLQALFSQVVHLYALQLLNQLLIVDCLIDKLKRFMGRNYWT